MTTRKLTLNEAMDIAHELAVKHVDKHKSPNRSAWYQEWDAFCGKTQDEYTHLDLRIIGSYAEAALRYDSARHDPTGGLWTRIRGNIKVRMSEPIHLSRPATNVVG